MNRSSRQIARRKLETAPVKVLCASVSRDPGVAELEIAERARASNHLFGADGSTQTGGHRHLQPTVSVSLDSLLTSFPAPHILKIDVESHELEVLRGAMRVLGARPVIWAEVDPSNAVALSDLLHRSHYQLFGAADLPHPAIERAWWNTLAVPEEKIARFAGLSRLQMQAAS
jgi:FkbM family methyltransferase